MIAMIFGGVLQSRALRMLIILAAVSGGFFVWHKADRSNAVRAAREGYVRQIELIAAQKQLEVLAHRQAIADTARRQLHTEIEKALAEAEAAEQELEHYVSTVEDNCVVKPGLAERLRNR
ncbi:hypothetical protein [Labrenzia sp. OB1]|uniref:hypothetical protein n=1 Tax=Labrenzia sp. OB1 TaxID=1561204 RepID=UPI0007B26818|nr:hypothetical protein [Labrenzia sp. OB1]KZM47441.1 hypothetical protein OA90_25870 [Labrenzia sp. OB1]